MEGNLIEYPTIAVVLTWDRIHAASVVAGGSEGWSNSSELRNRQGFNSIRQGKSIAHINGFIGMATCSMAQQNCLIDNRVVFDVVHLIGFNHSYLITPANWESG